MENFQRQQSVWSLVKEFVPDSEFPEVKAVLGDALVDMYTETYSEVQLWEQIWQEARCSGQDEEPSSPCSPLPDPPAIKDLLRAELQLLLLTLREQAARLGRDEGEVMGRYCPRVVNYALGDSGRGRRGSPDSCPPPSTSSMNHGGSSPDPRPSSRLLSRSSCADEIKALKHKLNIIHIDEAVVHLQRVLVEECEALQRDVHLLQESVELEYQKQADPDLVVPTLTELREERRLLQKDLHGLCGEGEATCLEIPEPCVPPPSRRELMQTTEAANLSDSLIPRTDYPYPHPCPPRAPASSQPGLSGRHRHRSAFKAVQASDSSLPPEQPKGLDLDRSNLGHWMSATPPANCHTLPPSNSSSSEAPFNHIVVPKEHPAQHSVSGTGSKTRPAVDSGHAQLRGTLLHSTQPGQPLLQPTPPAVQRMASRGPRASRRMVLPQTESLLSSS